MWHTILGTTVGTTFVDLQRGPGFVPFRITFWNFLRSALLSSVQVFLAKMADLKTAVLLFAVQADRAAAHARETCACLDAKSAFAKGTDSGLVLCGCEKLKLHKDEVVDKWMRAVKVCSYFLLMTTRILECLQDDNLNSPMDLCRAYSS